MTESNVKADERLKVSGSFIEGQQKTILLHLSNSNLGVDLVARLSGITRKTLQQRLRARGTTLSTEIREVKRQRACELMSKTDNSMADVAMALGFANPTSFARAFKSWTGESPREYRKKRYGHSDETRGL